MDVDANARRRAFTLLEIMLAVAILAMVGVSIYEFVELNMRAVLASSEQIKQDSTLRGLAALLQTQLNGLAPTAQDKLYGNSLTIHDGSSDSVTWFVQAGNGLLTKDASGNYFVTLMLRPSENAGAVFELGMQRILASDAGNKAQNAAQGSTAAKSGGDWVRLLDDVAAFEVRYRTGADPTWDTRTKWTNKQLPKLIRVRIWKNLEDDPYEVVLNLPLRAL